MTVAVAVAAAKTSTGTQDITTTDLGGETPKAALFIYSRAAADGTIVDDFGTSFGVADGTTQFALASFVNDGGASGPIGDHAKTTKCVCALHLDGTVKVHSEAAFSAFITNGVRINWTTATADGWLLTVVLFAGADWSVKAGTVTAVIGASVNVGFEPNAVMFFGRANGIPGPDSGGFGGSQVTTRARWSIGANGWAATKGRTGGVQWGWSWGVPTQEVLGSGGGAGSFGSAASASQFENGFGGSYGFAAEQTATGFIIDSDFVNPHDWGYLALKWDGGEVYCGHVVPAASTGDQSFTGFPFTPQFMFLMPSMVTVNGAPQFGRRGGVVAMTETKVGGFAGSARHSGSGNQIQKSVACEDTIRMIDQTSTAIATATLASFDNEGFTLNFSVAPAAGNWVWPFIAFGPDGGAGGGSASRNQAWIID